jgi:hypothetical protein
MNKNISDFTSKYTLENINKEQLREFDLLTLLFKARDGESVEEDLNKWKENYKDIKLEDWHFEPIDNWLTNGDFKPSIRANLEKALKVFKEHNSTLNAN